MTTEETILADKILKEAMTVEPGMRRNLILEYSQLVRAARDCHDASSDHRPSAMTATEVASIGDSIPVELYSQTKEAKRDYEMTPEELEQLKKEVGF